MIQIGYIAENHNCYMVNGEKREVTIVIGPLRVVERSLERGDKEYAVFNGCSRYYYCEDTECEYSRAGKELRKVSRQPLP